MNVDVLICEIGSTTTVVNAFDLKGPKYLGQGVYETTVDIDVTIGVEAAIANLKSNLNVLELTYNEMFATSSAAGGLKMTVHGLVYDMTATAAYETAVGAGANIEFITSGKLKASDLTKLKDIAPNIILIAGGVDYGEQETALYNSEQIASLQLNTFVIYAGNVQNIDEVKLIFDNYEQGEYLRISENVYPKIDQLNVVPTRKLIYDTFEEHIIYAKGMEKIFSYVTDKILPTPGAVLKANELLYEKYGDVMCFDIGGATTDLHSVTEGSEEINKILINVVPKAKRTVEGDLGVYVNKNKVLSYIGNDVACNALQLTEAELLKVLDEYEVIPKNDVEVQLVTLLAKECVGTALNRHAGQITNQYLTGGASQVANGKDLTAIKYIVCTGGVLTKLSTRSEIINSIFQLNVPNKLFPNRDATILYDNLYIMAAMGVLSLKYQDEALELLESSFVGDL